MINFTPLEDARITISHVLRTASQLDPISREHLAKAEYILRQECRDRTTAFTSAERGVS